MTKTRDRFVQSASRLFQEQGYRATSVGSIAEAGELPIGSLYYYFPGGKEELGVAAVSHGADRFEEVLREALSSSDDPGEALANCARLLADRLEASQWRYGCPVATVALETVHTSQLLQSAAADAFDAWVKIVSERLIDLGIELAAAKELGSITISILEGAEMMARVAKSRGPLDMAASRMRFLIPVEVAS